MTGFAKSGLPHTSNLQDYFRCLKAMDLQFAWFRVVYASGETSGLYLTITSSYGPQSLKIGCVCEDPFLHKFHEHISPHLVQVFCAAATSVGFSTGDSTERHKK